MENQRRCGAGGVFSGLFWKPWIFLAPSCGIHGLCLLIYPSIYLSDCIYLPLSTCLSPIRKKPLVASHPSRHHVSRARLHGSYLLSGPMGEIPQDHDAGAVCGCLHVGWNGVLSHLPLLAGGSGRFPQKPKTSCVGFDIGLTRWATTIHYDNQLWLGFYPTTSPSYRIIPCQYPYQYPYPYLHIHIHIFLQ